MKRHRKVYIRKDHANENPASPWTVRLIDSRGRETGRVHVHNWDAAFTWARLFLNPADVMAEAWDQGAERGRTAPFGWGLFGEPINPYRSIAQRARRAENR